MVPRDSSRDRAWPAPKPISRRLATRFVWCTRREAFASAVAARSTRSDAGSISRLPNAHGSWRNCRRASRRSPAREAARTNPLPPRRRRSAAVRNRFLLLLLIGLLIAILIVLARNAEGTVGPLSTGDFASLAYKILLLVFLGGAVLTMFRERFSQAITAALLWVVVGLVLVVAYSYRFELHEVADRVLVVLVPGHVLSHGRSVEIGRGNGGDFAITAQINGARIAMVLDTGASSVVLTRDDAKAAGLPLEVLNYTVSIDTANARAQLRSPSTASPSAAWSSARWKRWWRSPASSR